MEFSVTCIMYYRESVVDLKPCCISLLCIIEFIWSVMIERKLFSHWYSNVTTRSAKFLIATLHLKVFTCWCYFLFYSNGNEKCVSHFCYSNKETKVHKNNETESCLKNGRSYQHLENWLEKDGCTNCTCFNGTENCSNDLCDPPASKISECQPLAGCNKTCLNGYKINKKGCEICKCNTIKLGQDILGKYNITMGDLIAILEDYKNKRTSTTTISTTSTTSATTTTPVPFIEILKTADPVVIAVAHNAKLEVISSTTTEPSVVPTGNGSGEITFSAYDLLRLISVVDARSSLISIICYLPNSFLHNFLYYLSLLHTNRLTFFAAWSVLFSKMYEFLRPGESNNSCHSFFNFWDYAL